MKKILIFLVLFVLYASPRLMAQISPRMLEHSYSFGVSSGQKYNSGYGFRASYDLRVFDGISFGFMGNFFFEDVSYSDQRDLFLGARTNIHLMPLFTVYQSDYDFYLGGALGTTTGHHSEDLTAEGWLGLRYSMNENWSVYTEIGTTFSIGLVYRFRQKDWLKRLQ
ncbi:hypothetical protein [Labilibaculum sp.]|uniref:hypothetical protein n=1 Tax=Labilibaculum sp. TaxID=2060723 RepID=UPI00356AE118